MKLCLSRWQAVSVEIVKVVKTVEGAKLAHRKSQLVDWSIR
jgi:hypothetical protein